MNWFFIHKKVELPKNMIDIHNHVLFDLDDGASNVEESLEMLALFSEAGFTEIITTSHLCHPMFPHVNIDNIQQRIKTLHQHATQHNLDITLHKGAEIYYDQHLLEKIKQGELVSLGEKNSPYMLIEFPINDRVPNFKELSFSIGLLGVRPILAHPERYQIFHENPQLANAWRQAGWAFQLDLDSLCGTRGSYVRKLARQFLRNHLFDVAASDLHSSTPSKQLNEMLRAFAKETNEKETIRLLVENPRRILQGKSLMDVE